MDRIEAWIIRVIVPVLTQIVDIAVATAIVGMMVYTILVLAP